MILSRQVGSYPASRTLNAEDVLEYHAARILLLLHLVGTKGAIRGLTKLAKLDFFVRYPSFFAEAARAVGASTQTAIAEREPDSAMIRYHYGPWDPRYYQVLAYLESRCLLNVERDNRAFTFVLTDEGATFAKQLSSTQAFGEQALQMKSVKRVFGGKSGNSLKKLVYQVFDREVAQLARGEVIR